MNGCVASGISDHKYTHTVKKKEEKKNEVKAAKMKRMKRKTERRMSIEKKKSGNIVGTKWLVKCYRYPGTPFSFCAIYH